MMVTSGRTKNQALLDSVREVSISIVLSTITRILSFLGMFAVTGMMGDYMKPIPVFASIALTASLFVAFSINPFLASVLTKKQVKHGEHAPDGKILSWYTRLISHYTGRSKEVTKRRRLLAPIFWIALGFVIALPIIFDVFRVRMLPKADKDQIYLWIDLPRNTSIDTTKQAAELASSVFFSGSLLPEKLRVAYRVSTTVGDRFVPDFSNLFRGSQDRKGSNQVSMKIDISHA